MIRAALFVVLLVAACKPRVRAGDADEPPRPSKEQESCAATADCEAPLRCVAQTCVRPETSRLGEYNWTAGRVALERGQKEQATVRFEEALSQFESEKVPPPAALLCDYGEALRRRAGDAKAAEQAARLLHRCLLATASESPDHVRALRELVELEAAGLEPSLIARSQPGDRYLTRDVAPPAPKGVRIEVAAKKPSGDPGFQMWLKRLGSDDVKALLTPCWSKSGGGAAEVTLACKLRARLGDDDVYLGGTMELGADPARPVADPVPALEACVREALAEPATEAAKRGHEDSWNALVSIRFTPE